MTVSHKDIKVLQRSPVFDKFVIGDAPSVNFEIMGHPYNKGYYLDDGIYPPWPVFLKICCGPKDKKYQRFAKGQRACRKDA
jgi:hypothetical protein